MLRKGGNRMIDPELHTNNQIDSEKKEILTGTLVSVCIVGLIVAAIWISVYALFIDRLG